MFSLGGRIGLVLAILVVACAPTSRPPASGTAQREDTSISKGEAEAEAAEDADGEAEATDEPAGPAEAAPCPANMVLVATAEARFCIDKYEASLVEVEPDGSEKPYPHWLPVDGHVVRAVSEPDVFPQGFISEVQAEDACAASGKRLCAHGEWKTACIGPAKTTFPYGDARSPGVCHDTGKSAVGAVFGARALTDPVVSTRPASKPGASAATTKAASARGAKGAGSGPNAKRGKPHRQAHATKGRAAETTRPRASRPGKGPAAAPAKRAEKSGPRERPTARAKRTPAKSSTRPTSVEPSVWTQLNDPRLGQVDGALAKTGSHAACVNGFGVVDMVGNLHEWVKTDPSLPHGTFAGGYYLDTALNGDGCQYRTTAHAHDYHDYSTGFRCCAEARPEGPPAQNAP